MKQRRRERSLRNGIKASKDIALLSYIPDNNNQTTPTFLLHLIDLHTHTRTHNDVVGKEAATRSVFIFFPFVPRFILPLVIKGDRAALGWIGRASIQCKGRESGLGSLEG